MSDSREPGLPPAPEAPDPDACCGSGCDPCIFDIHEQRLERWRRRCEQLRTAARDGDRATPHS